MNQELKQVTKTDHRSRVTKMLIRNAFTSLLTKKPIQSISIKELCDEAGINRGTFYTHYADIYDLLEQLEQEMYKELEQALEPLLSIESGSLSPVELSTTIFECLKNNVDLCIVTLGDYGDKAFALKLLNLGREKCMETYSKYFKNVSHKKIEYFYVFVSAGCMGLLQKWAAEGLIIPAKEMAEMAEQLMMEGIAFLGD